MVNGEKYSNFVVKSKVYHFDHGKFVFWPWSWLKRVFLWLNFLANFEVNHFDREKFGFWPWSWSKFRPFDHSYFKIFTMVMVKNF